MFQLDHGQIDQQLRQNKDGIQDYETHHRHLEAQPAVTFCSNTHPTHLVDSVSHKWTSPYTALTQFHHFYFQSCPHLFFLIMVYSSEKQTKRNTHILISLVVLSFTVSA